MVHCSFFALAKGVCTLEQWKRFNYCMLILPVSHIFIQLNYDTIISEKGRSRAFYNPPFYARASSG